MAKTVITAESDFNELITDTLKLAEEFPDAIMEAAEAQLQVFEDEIKSNWVSMVPWAHVGDYVYDSIGYNVEQGKNKIDVVGMAGVFLVDSVAAKHGRDAPVQRKNGIGTYERIKAPQLAYWVEFGYAPNHGKYQVGIPFMSNAYYASLGKQDEVFADTLSAAIDKRLNK